MKKSVATTLAMLSGAAAGAFSVSALSKKIIEKKEGKINKFKKYYDMLNQWMIIKQEGKSLENYFINNGYHSIAIYGMGEMGNRLYEDLKGTKITVKYAIDKEAGLTYAEVETREITDTLPTVDAIVVTAVFAFDEIEESLKKTCDYPIISLQDVIYDL